MKRVIIAIVMMALAGVSYGEILVAWENNDCDSATQTNKFADTTASGVSSAELAFGDGLTEVGYNDAFSSRDDNGWSGYQSTLADAITADARYYIKLDFSQSYDITNLFIRLAIQNASTGTVATFTLRSSLTGTTDLDSYELTQSGGNNPFTTDLSGVAALQGITAVDFYLYLHTDLSGYSQNGIGAPYNANAENDLVIYGESGGAATTQATTYHIK